MVAPVIKFCEFCEAQRTRRKMWSRINKIKIFVHFLSNVIYFFFNLEFWKSLQLYFYLNITLLICYKIQQSNLTLDRSSWRHKYYILWKKIVFALQFVHRRKKIFQILIVVIQISLKHTLNHKTITHDLIKEADTNK